MKKRWDIKAKVAEHVIEVLLKQRNIDPHPPDPSTFSASDVGIDDTQVKKAVIRIQKAIQNKESIVVYADYDADGICAGAIMWETLWKLGARVMPYIPHRVEEGYGLSQKGIDQVRKEFDPTLIITVDHGISGAEKVAYAKTQGIEVIVTDHHSLPKNVPDCVTVHTTQLSGSGVSWFLANKLSPFAPLELAAIGTIADLLPLVGANRSIVKYGLKKLQNTTRVGLNALFADSGKEQKDCDTFTVSHMLAPRINAMGRLEHAIDALRLLCTNDKEKAQLLAEKLGLTNRERQKLTEETVAHALTQVVQDKKLFFIADASYNQGIIGLVAGKLVEHFYRPSIVVSVGETLSKASARSVVGFNIIEAIRLQSDLLVEAGGHPMAAGFTVGTAKLEALKLQLETFAEEVLTQELLTRVLAIDVEIPFDVITEDLWKQIQQFAPFGYGNTEPVFATRNVKIKDVRPVGKDSKHLKLKIENFDAIAFGFGEMAKEVTVGTVVDVAYAIDMNEWNGQRKLQLKVKDIVMDNSL